MGTIKDSDSTIFASDVVYFDYINQQQAQSRAAEMLQQMAAQQITTDNQTGNDMAHKFQKGDKVRLLRHSPTYNPSDDVTVGEIGEIIEYNSQRQAYMVKFPLKPESYTAEASILEKVEAEVMQEPVKEKAVVTFDSVIIDDGKRQQILEALEQINQQDLIFKKWGFEETIEKGRGVSILFYGPPGTGKTLMAQAIAHKLGRPLRVIATADVESSVPGEAERNVRKHFTDAQQDKAILLFDECDSLIFSRESVGPIMAAQTNELLSQIERFNGITVFTTNRLGTLDEAVNRRIVLKLEFGMPTPAERVEIWKRMFPKKAPLAEDVDWSRLAIVEVTGGHIKNAVLRAARMAAVEDKPDKKKKITMEHLVASLKFEATAMAAFDKARQERNSRGMVVSPPGKGKTLVKQESGL